MKILLIIIGGLIALGAIGFYGYLLPLACGMNTTGCRESFSIFDEKSLILFWPAFLIGVALVSFGLTWKRKRK